MSEEIGLFREKLAALEATPVESTVPQPELTVSPVEALKQQAAQLKAERDRAFIGTPPEEVWGESGKALCDEFIRFAEARSFAGSVLLQSHVVNYPELRPMAKRPLLHWLKPGTTREDWESLEHRTRYQESRAAAVTTFNFTTRAYKLAQAIGIEDAAKLAPHTLPTGTHDDNVFICEDGSLRMLSSRSYPDGHGSKIESVPSKYFLACPILFRGPNPKFVETIYTQGIATGSGDKFNEGGEIVGGGFVDIYDPEFVTLEERLIAIAQDIVDAAAEK